MRISALLGFVLALVVGGASMAVMVASLADQPPINETLAPFTPPAALTTLPPTATPVLTPVPAVTPTPSVGESSVPVGTAIGQLAPGFTLPNLEGGEIGTAASAGKPLWINFWASWCPQCIDELPMVQTFKYDLGDSIDLIMVDEGEDAETVLNFLTRLQVDLPVALDQDGTVQHQWQAFALPVHFWLDGNGIVQEIVYGGAPPELFQQAIRKVVPGASFPPP
jgi:thiol-disulfide isomerase/thioredoxin